MRRPISSAPALPREVCPTDRLHCTMSKTGAEQEEVEALEGKLFTANQRLKQLQAAISAEEGTLVRAAMAEAEENAAAERRGKPSALAGPRPTEERLRARVAQAQELLKQEHAKFKTLMDNGSVQLALAVEQGVGDYYSDVRTVRRSGNPVHSDNPAAIAAAGSQLKKLNAERTRLAEAVRKLNEESDALTAESRAVAKSKEQLLNALKRKDRQNVVRYG